MDGSSDKLCLDIKSFQYSTEILGEHGHSQLFLNLVIVFKTNRLRISWRIDMTYKLVQLKKMSAMV